MRRFRIAARRRSTRRSSPPTTPFPPQVTHQREQGESVAVPPEAADPADDHVFDHGHFPEFLPARGVGEVHLNGRQAAVVQGVPDGHAGVRVRRGVDHDPVEAPLRRLEPLDDLALVVRLEEGDRRALRPGRRRHLFADVGKCFPPVDGRLALPENVQVGTVDEQDPERPLPLHSIPPARRAAWRRRNRHFPGTVPGSVTITRKYSGATLRMNTCARSPPRWTSSAAPSPFSAAMRSDSRKNWTISAERAERSRSSPGARHSSTVSPSTPASAPEVTPGSLRWISSNTSRKVISVLLRHGFEEPEELRFR